MCDCVSGLAERFRRVVNQRDRNRNNQRRSSPVPSNPTNTQTSTSSESLDSGFIDLSESSSSFSLKSILRQPHLSNTPVGDPKKKVSICAPKSPLSLSRRRINYNKGERKKISSQMVHDKEGQLADPPAVLDISAQISQMLDSCKSCLMDLYPHLSPSIDLLFTPDLSLRLSDLSSNKIAELIYSLRVLLFSPPPRYRDIIINKVMELLVSVTKTLELEPLHGECEMMCEEVCKSGKYYQNSEFYWAHAQTLMISVWCKIILL